MLKKILLSLLVVLIILILPTFISLGEKDSESEVTIYLISTPIHTDLILPVKNEIFDWEKFYDSSAFESRPTEWIQVGWGDRKFYQDVPTWDELTIGKAVDALFFPGPSAMHVNYLDSLPETYSDIREIKISQEKYFKIVTAIRGSFKLKDGKPQLIPEAGYSETDNFYEAEGTFSFINTCNVWTSNMLAEADLKHPLWSPSKYGLEMAWDF